MDLKIFSSGLHKQYCGINNQVILDNLLRTNQLEKCPRLVVRTPIIPGINDDFQELENIGRFCAQLNWLDHVELLPYHKLGTATYEKLGRPYLLGEVPTPTPEQMEVCRNVVRRHVKTVR